MQEYVYILFSDGTWSAIAKEGRFTSLEDRIKQRVKGHCFPFPLDIEGDIRRNATIIKNANEITYMKGI